MHQGSETKAANLQLHLHRSSWAAEVEDRLLCHSHVDHVFQTHLQQRADTGGSNHAHRTLSSHTLHRPIMIPTLMPRLGYSEPNLSNSPGEPGRRWPFVWKLAVEFSPNLKKFQKLRAPIFSFPPPTTKIVNLELCVGCAKSTYAPHQLQCLWLCLPPRPCRVKK